MEKKLEEDLLELYARYEKLKYSHTPYNHQLRILYNNTIKQKGKVYCKIVYGGYFFGKR